MCQLLSIIKDDKSRNVFLNGEWGSGKSFLIDKVYDEIKEKKDIISLINKAKSTIDKATQKRRISANKANRLKAKLQSKIV